MAEGSGDGIGALEPELLRRPLLLLLLLMLLLLLLFFVCANERGAPTTHGPAARPATRTATSLVLVLVLVLVPPSTSARTSTTVPLLGCPLLCAQRMPAPAAAAAVFLAYAGPIRQN